MVGLPSLAVMTTSAPTGTSAGTGTRALAWAVLAAAVLQVVVPGITIAGSGEPPGAGSAPDLLVSPAGWAFAIWGVIYAAAIAQAVVVLVRGHGGVPRRLQVDQLVLYLGGALWIVMSTLDSSLATAAALLLMLVAAVDGVLVAARRVGGAGWFPVLTRSAVGLYAGWVTAAFFLNLGTALVEADAVGVDRLGWQLALLVVAGLTLLALVLRTRVVAYAAAGVWALVGIAVTGATNDDRAVLGLAAATAGVLALALAAAVLTSRRRSPAAPA